LYTFPKLIGNSDQLKMKVPRGSGVCNIIVDLRCMLFVADATHSLFQ